LELGRFLLAQLFKRHPAAMGAASLLKRGNLLVVPSNVPV
jgi:hypothetical protein